MGTVRMVMIFDAPLERVYASWREPDRLSEAFDFVETVDRDDEGLVLHYRGLMGKSRELRLRITEDVNERCLAWRGDASSLNVTGSLSFDAKGAQTYVTLVLGWRPPLGRVGDIIGSWMKYPDKPLREGLVRFEKISRRPLS